MLKSKKLLIYLLAVVLILLFAAGLFLFLKPSSVGVADAASDPLIDGAVYTIQNKATGYYMDINGQSASNYANVITWYGNNALNQRFILRKVTANEWEMFPMHVPSATHLIVVQNASGSNGESIILYQDNGTANQKFKFVANADGSYKIKTQSSGYNLAIGMQNNSYEPAAICTQISVNSSTTDWVLKQIWTFSDKGKRFTTSEPLPTPKAHPIFGEVSKAYDDTIIEKEVVESTSFWIPVKKIRIKDVQIKYWRYSIPVNMVLHAFTNFKEVDPIVGDIIQISQTQSATVNYKQSIMFGLNFGLTTKLGASILQGLQLINSYSGGVDSQITNTYGYSQQRTFSITSNLPLITKNLDMNKIYACRAEKRGYVYLNFVQVFKYNYHQKRANLGNQNVYTYELINKSLDEELFQWSIDENTITEGNFPYEFNTQTHIYDYCGNKYDNVLYC